VTLSLEPSDRAVLHARIEQRFDAMLDAGLLDEVRALRARWPTLHPALPSMRCVGYRQAWEHLDGHTDAAELRARGIAATRQLAKRQLTWLRSTPVDVRLDCLAPDVESRVVETASAALRANARVG
jgi:tRNA dimethylallyltransferase